MADGSLSESKYAIRLYGTSNCNLTLRTKLNNVPEVPADEFREVKTISPKITVIMYNGRKYILKNQVYPHDDLLFHREIEV